jgi:hypothetical protein
VKGQNDINNKIGKSPKLAVVYVKKAPATKIDEESLDVTSEEKKEESMTSKTLE